jgi:hypothetical protein
MKEKLKKFAYEAYCFFMPIAVLGKKIEEEEQKVIKTSTEFIPHISTVTGGWGYITLRREKNWLGVFRKFLECGYNVLEPPVVSHEIQNDVKVFLNINGTIYLKEGIVYDAFIRNVNINEADNAIRINVEVSA